MDKKASKAIRMIMSLLLAVVLLYFAFRGIEWADFFAGLDTTVWGYVVLSMAAGLAALVFRAERWRTQLACIDPDVRRISIWDGSNVGNFLNLVIPGIGEFYRCAHVTSGSGAYDRTFGTILMERAWDLLAVVVLLLCAVFADSEVLLPFLQQHVLGPFISRFNISLLWIMVILLVPVSVGAFIMSRFREKNRFCARCFDTLRGVFKGFSSFSGMHGKWLFLFYTAGIWFMYILMTYFTFLAVPGLQALTFSDAVFISAVGNIASVIPTPGNLGAYHYIVGMAISSIFMGSSVILPEPLLFATLSHGSHAILLIILAIFSYIALQINKTNIIKS